MPSSLDEATRGVLDRSCSVSGEKVYERIRTSWPSWRGRAVEPTLREGIDRLGEAVVATAPLDARDLARLVVHRSKLPGASDTTP